MDGLKVASSQEAEARAILAIVIKARPRDFSKVHIFSDALEVVRGTNISFDWSIDPILHGIESLASNFEWIEFSFNPRIDVELYCS